MTQITKPVLAGLALVMSMAAQAKAGPCDYKPSRLAGKAAEMLSRPVAGGASAGEMGMKAVGVYSLLYPGSGVALMSGSAAGGSAAGAAGMLAQAGSLVGGIAGVVVAPVTLAASAGLGAFEGVCYFKVERVTEPDAILEIVASAAAADPKLHIVGGNAGARLIIEGPEGPQEYLLEKLYIADGVLKYRNFGLNTSIGPIVYHAPDRAALDEATAEAGTATGAPEVPAEGGTGAAPEAPAPEAPAPQQAD